MKPFYSLKVKDDNAELYIYGDIASDGCKWSENDVSANDIVNQLQGLNAKKIDVYINSYGGEVAQGLAIYNVLKQKKCKVTTICDGFACSIASVIFMAGTCRKVNKNSLLMIHNAWTIAQGNAEQLEKQAEDLRLIDEAVKQAYLEEVNISDEELKNLLDAETWITPEKAVEMGFATEIIEEKAPEKASANAAAVVYAALVKAAEIEVDPDDPNDPDDDQIETILSDIVARLEKLEAEVFPEDKGEEKPEEQPEENPEENQTPEAKNAFMEKFLKIF